MNATSRQADSVSVLLGSLAQGTATLVRHEVALARTELSITAEKAASHAALLAGGAAIAHAAVLALTAAVVIGLSNVVPLWLAATLVGATLALVAGVMCFIAVKALTRMRWAPEETMSSIKAVVTAASPHADEAAA
ncbi:hypothetical protein BH09MYX1_BH09MYX1_00380 [soil metagenome]